MVLNFNKASEADLKALYGISDARAQVILSLRAEKGGCLTEDDLHMSSKLPASVLDQLFAAGHYCGSPFSSPTSSPVRSEHPSPSGSHHSGVRDAAGNADQAGFHSPLAHPPAGLHPSVEGIPPLTPQQQLEADRDLEKSASHISQKHFQKVADTLAWTERALHQTEQDLFKT